MNNNEYLLNKRFTFTSALLHLIRVVLQLYSADQSYRQSTVLSFSYLGRKLVNGKIKAGKDFYRTVGKIIKSQIPNMRRKLVFMSLIYHFVQVKYLLSPVCIGLLFSEFGAVVMLGVPLVIDIVDSQMV